MASQIPNKSSFLDPPSFPTTASYNYPFAAAPDIIRSNQKDTYFQGVLYEQLSNILRRLYGARFIHNYNSEARTFTELLYLGLTTFIGNRTLGEEYCDIIQVSDDTRRMPEISRRARYILAVVLLPYGLMKILPAFRTRIRLKLEASIRRQNLSSEIKPTGSKPLTTKVQTYILTHLADLTSPSPLYAFTLTAFYFSGAYYHLSKRIFGLRYIFTKQLPPSEQRVGYEVLGVLLVLQIAFQGWMRLRSTLRSSQQPVMDAGSLATGGSAIVDGGVEVGTGGRGYVDPSNDLLVEANPAHHGDIRKRVQAVTHTPLVAEEQPRYYLKDPQMIGWIQGRQQRKCTLCLEEMRDPSVTTCGHVFCWTCIGDWIREKPECPLCRQAVLRQHVLPLRG